MSALRRTCHPRIALRLRGRRGRRVLYGKPGTDKTFCFRRHLRDAVLDRQPFLAAAFEQLARGYPDLLGEILDFDTFLGHYRVPSPPDNRLRTVMSLRTCQAEPTRPPSLADERALRWFATNRNRIKRRLAGLTFRALLPGTSSGDHALVVFSHEQSIKRAWAAPAG